MGEGNPRPRRQPTSPSDGGWKLRVGLAGSEPDLGDNLTVLGFSDRCEAHTLEECLRALLARTVDDVHVIDTVLACLGEQAFDGESADS